jgi:hypothetical protein
MTDVTVSTVVNEIEVVIAEAPAYEVVLGTAAIDVSVADATDIEVSIATDVHQIVVEDAVVTIETSSPVISMSPSATTQVDVGVSNLTVDSVITENVIKMDIGVGVQRPVEVVPFPVPTTTWVVDVGRMVDVVVIDSAGQVIWPGQIVYGPGYKITMQFSHPFSGQVHCYS